MLKYDKKNQFNLMMEAQRLIKLRQQESLIKQNITDAILRGWTPDENQFKEMFEDPHFNGDEGVIMDTLLYIDLIGEINREVFFNYFAYTNKKIDVNGFLNNPYIKNIKFDKNFFLNKNNIALTTSCFDKYEIQQLDTCKMDSNYTVKPSLGFFNEKVHFPILTENDEVWMSITPSEINTMENHINNMKGKVLVFGLGLGYFAYMTALKDNVESVTIIELNKDIIDIFEENILVQMDDKLKSKINIIHDDAKNIFLDKEYMDSFDSCFIDIWMNTIDGAPLYSYFKENEKKLKIKPKYWIEDDILLMYKYDLIAYISYIILKDVNESKEYKETYYSVLKCRPFMNKIEKYFKKNNHVINSKKDIYNLVFNTNIMNKILKLSID